MQADEPNENLNRAEPQTGMCDEFIGHTFEKYI